MKITLWNFIGLIGKRLPLKTIDTNLLSEKENSHLQSLIQDADFFHIPHNKKTSKKPMPDAGHVSIEIDGYNVILSDRPKIEKRLKALMDFIDRY